MYPLTPEARTSTVELEPYSETVARGLHVSPMGGLWGQHDNVRTYWETHVTQTLLRPFVVARDRAARTEGRKVRILDLGCGAGNGYDLLVRIAETGLNLGDGMRFVLPPDRIGLYLGLDLSEAMVEQGRQNFLGRSTIRFERADLRQGLATVASKGPFDFYLSSYGSLSHLNRSELKRCLADVARNAALGAVVVLDLVGRYSPEWPGYWSSTTEAEKTRPYSINYLYDQAKRPNGSTESFPLRFWTNNEVRDLCSELTAETGVAVDLARMIDRSVFVGRHVDTREYGCPLPPLRGLVNRLYEQNVRTRIEDLSIDYRPDAPNEDVERFFTSLAMSWNVLINFTLERLDGVRVDLIALEGWQDFPPALQLALMTMDRIVDSISWIDIGDIRANILEPQLAFVLQRLEYSLQRGLGCGHGLVAVLRIRGMT